MKFSMITLLAIGVAPTLLNASPVDTRSPGGVVETPTNALDLPQPPVHTAGSLLEVVPDHIPEQFEAGPTSGDSDDEYSISERANLQERWNTICETTVGSPTSWHVEVSINFLKDKADEACVQWNKNSGPSCTPIMTWGTAQIAICGEYGYRMVCSSAADFAKAVFTSCRNTIGGVDKVGGITLIRGQKGSSDYRGIQIYHAI